MSLFSSERVDAAYDRWQEPESGHEEDGCFDCHKEHSGTRFNNECDFCDEEVHVGKRCWIHPKALFEPAEKGKASWCEFCQED